MLLPGAAVRADAVDFDAVAHDLVIRGVAHFADHVLDVRECYVFRRPAAHAHKVVVVRGMAHPVGDRSVSQHEAADEALIHQKLQRSVHRGATNRRKFASESFRREVVLAARDGFNDKLTR